MMAKWKENQIKNESQMLQKAKRVHTFWEKSGESYIWLVLDNRSNITDWRRRIGKGSLVRGVLTYLEYSSCIGWAQGAPQA